MTKNPSYYIRGGMVPICEQCVVHPRFICVFSLRWRQAHEEGFNKTNQRCNRTQERCNRRKERCDNTRAATTQKRAATRQTRDNLSGWADLRTVPLYEMSVKHPQFIEPFRASKPPENHHFVAHHGGGVAVATFWREFRDDSVPEKRSIRRVTIKAYLRMWLGVGVLCQRIQRTWMYAAFYVNEVAESLSRRTCVYECMWSFLMDEFAVFEWMQHYECIWSFLRVWWMNLLYLNECSILSIRNDHMHSYGQIRCIWMDAAFYVNEFLGSLSRRTCVYVCMHIRWIRSLEYGCMRWIHSLKYGCMPHEKLLGITWVSNPATRKDLAARTYGVFWY